MVSMSRSAADASDPHGIWLDRIINTMVIALFRRVHEVSLHESRICYEDSNWPMPGAAITAGSWIPAQGIHATSDFF